MLALEGCSNTSSAAAKNQRAHHSTTLTCGCCDISRSSCSTKQHACLQQAACTGHSKPINIFQLSRTPVPAQQDLPCTSATAAATSAADSNAGLSGPQNPPNVSGKCYLVVRLPSAAKACSSCTMRSYTRKVIALWGMTRSTWGAMPLYRPLAPSRAMMVRNACLVFPYRSTRPASWRCCTLVRTTCGWELVRACLHLCQLVSASRVFGQIGGRVVLPCSSCSGHSQPASNKCALRQDHAQVHLLHLRSIPCTVHESSIDASSM